MARVFVTIAKPDNKIVGTFSNGIDYETPFIKEVRQNGWVAGELPVSVDDAIVGMTTLRKHFGLLCGLSAGGVYSAYRKRLESGESTGHVLLLAWDSHDRWVEKLV